MWNLLCSKLPIENKQVLWVEKRPAKKFPKFLKSMELIFRVKFFSLSLVIFFFANFTSAQIQASFTMDVNSGCPPLTVNFTNTTPGGMAGFYQWDFGDGNVSTAFSPTHIFQSAGSYFITLNGTGFDGFPLITAFDSVNVSGASISVFPEICLVTVDSTFTKNIIVWEKPTDPAVGAVNIYRESDSSWALIGTVPKDSLSKFVDTGINPDSGSYSYRISFLDTCGNESGMSAFHHTMHLIGYSVPPSIDANLTWVDYSGFIYSSYNIYRDTTGQGNFLLIDSVPAGMVNYVDSNPPLNSEYLVEIIRPEACTVTKLVENHNSSRSNKTTSAPQGSSIYKAKNSEFSIEIIPNPNKGIFQISLIGKNTGKFDEVKIYNVPGEIVYHSPKIQPYSSYSIDLSNMGGGIYFLQIVNEDRIVNKKIVVE